MAAAGLFATQFVARNRRFEEFNDKDCGYENLAKNYHRDCQPLYDRGKRAEKWATVSGVAAGALGVGAAVLFVTVPEAPMAVSAGPSGGRLGLSLQGRF